jgi:hypothetical protein
MARQQKKRAEKAKPEQKICRQDRFAGRLGKNEKQGDLFTRWRDLQMRLSRERTTYPSFLLGKFYSRMVDRRPPDIIARKRKTFHDSSSSALQP